MKRCVAYYRVSTDKQGKSGLGLDAQRETVASFVRSDGAALLREFTEVESGTKSDRPELLKAIAFARRSKATLVIARLDRLARNMAFVANLMESKVEFVACDMPYANRLTIHVVAAVAEDFARRIRENTKAALAAKKARGAKLGSARPGHWDGRDHKRLAGLRKARARSIVVKQQAALEAYADVQPVIVKLREQGKSLRAIADHLNERGERTRNDRPWNHVQVMNVLQLTGSATVSSI